MKRQCLKLYFLRHQGQAITCAYALRYNNTLFVYETGFNSEWKKWSLGTVLTGYCIRKSIGEGLREFHYLREPGLTSPGGRKGRSRFSVWSWTVVRFLRRRKKQAEEDYHPFSRCRYAAAHPGIVPGPRGLIL